MGEDLRYAELTPDTFAGCGEVPSPIRIGDKWTSRILVCLDRGPLRFSQLRVPLPEVTPKVLTESLRSMQRSGLVTRTSHGGVPPRVEYALTDVGRGLLEFQWQACGWNREFGARLADARREWARRGPA
ncbi:winged helix-turn-helix transcriptional regulator [Actinokineospora sp. G85]|uniref:winged helix-turn-helix transcriptional regulator n=1 Tax=Actinokineospora sp. G85 TaxID=3406626 RepID=UPI003C76D12C